MDKKKTQNINWNPDKSTADRGGWVGTGGGVNQKAFCGKGGRDVFFNLHNALYFIFYIFYILYPSQRKLLVDF